MHADTEGIPGVWASSHHDGIVWCNQLVVKLSVLLRDIAIRALAASEESMQQRRHASDSPPTEADGSVLASRAAMVMRRAEVALRGGDGRSLADRLMITKKDWKLDEVLEGADRKPCTGANLAWYQQYNTAKTVTKPLLQLKPSSVKVWGVWSMWGVHGEW